LLPAFTEISLVNEKITPRNMKENKMNAIKIPDFLASTDCDMIGYIILIYLMNRLYKCKNLGRGNGPTGLDHLYGQYFGRIYAQIKIALLQSDLAKLTTSND
jgi:hypothetical protein